MTMLRQMLAERAGVVWDTTKDATVEDALALMAQKNVGALVVRDGGKLVGIFTERHFARKVFLAGKTAPTTKVGDVMSTKVMVGRPDSTVEEALGLMTSQGFRHLPVCDDDVVIGMVTMTDLVRHLVGEREFTIEQLEQYVHG
jgi:CBS domain-containing protein